MTISVIVLFRILAASQVTLTLIGLLASGNPARVKIILFCLGIGAVGYFVEPLVQSPVVLAPLTVFANAIPMFLWATCRILFNDDTRLPPLAVVLAAAALALIIAAMFRTATAVALTDIEFAVFRMLPQVIKLGFVILAIHVSWVGRETDLVESRRRARRWFALGLGAMIAIVVATEIVTVFHVPVWLERAGMVAMFALTIWLNLLLFKPNPAFAIPQNLPASATPPTSAADDPLLAELQRLMVDERSYADHDIRIGRLAEQLAIPEHRLRAAINGKLGYRNFNQYVNGFRIIEASRRLLSEANLPVLSIALDVGFRSLSAFNQAFRGVHGCTPTEFRSRSGALA
jgi:AraC-like DNA-binding protein